MSLEDVRYRWYHGQKKILLADDEQAVRALVAATIAAVGDWQLLEADNGLTALEIARQERPSLVLLDILMPGLDGLEVCRRLKADSETESIPIIILTALADKEHELLAKEMGANGYFTKPFHPLSLLDTVDKFLADR